MKKKEKKEFKVPFSINVQKIKKTESVVRSNHGVLIDSGYDADGFGDEHEKEGRLSSVTRRKKSIKALEKITDPADMLDCISDSTSDKNPQMNPLRRDPSRSPKVLETTGQIMLSPDNLTLSYRPITSKLEFDFNKLDGQDRKTSFEVVSAKKLLSFSEAVKYRKI